jgi:CheY-like chemotaxis protein
MGAPKASNRTEPSPPRIFVVDDEPILLEMAENVLRGLNAEVSTFENADVALETFTAAKPPPDLIITDFAMHEMDGLALIRACRRLHPKQRILLVSGTVDESVFDGTGVKPDRFLAKPYQPADLTNLVRELLED